MGGKRIRNQSSGKKDAGVSKNEFGGAGGIRGEGIRKSDLKYENSRGQKGS